MKVDLKWIEATSMDKNVFTAVDAETPWPESMDHFQLAVLQRPWSRGDAPSVKACQLLIETIQRACNAGDLSNEPREVTRYGRKGRRIRSSLEGTHYNPPPKPYQVTLHCVRAADFADWLRTQGEEPSEYIAHWFKVRGVAAPAVLKLAQSAPAIDAVVEPADFPPKVPTTWEELLPYHKANPGHLWTVALKNIVADERGRRGEQPGAAAAMGAALGFKGVERVNSLVRTKDQHGKRKTSTNRRTGTR